NDAAVSKYQAARDREMQEVLMSRTLWKSAMLNYQATGLELVALSFAMHHYFRCVEHSPTASKEEREMAFHLRQFFDRLMPQLPPGNTQYPPYPFVPFSHPRRVPYTRRGPSTSIKSSGNIPICKYH